MRIARPAFLRLLLTLVLFAAPLPALAQGVPRVVWVLRGAEVLSAEQQEATWQAMGALLAQRGEQLEDVSALHAAVFHEGLFPDLSAPPPADWPAALKADWEAGHAACRARGASAERARPGDSQGMEADCLPQLSGALWARWLAHERPARVVEVSLARPDAGAPGLTLLLVAYRPGEARGQRVKAQLGGPEDVPRMAKHALGLLVQELGTAQVVNVSTELPRAPEAPAAAPTPEVEAPSLAEDVP